MKIIGYHLLSYSWFYSHFICDKVLLWDEQKLFTWVDVPGGEFAMKTNEGFELVAFIGDSINFENNFDSMTDDERIIKVSARSGSIVDNVKFHTSENREIDGFSAID